MKIVGPFDVGHCLVIDALPVLFDHHILLPVDAVLVHVGRMVNWITCCVLRLKVVLEHVQHLAERIQVGFGVPEGVLKAERSTGAFVVQTTKQIVRVFHVGVQVRVDRR